jgi:hypothetical protein
MRKKIISFALLISAVSFGPVNSVFADAVYAKGERVLLADDDLMIYDTNDPDTPLEKIEVGNATDVTVSGCNAVVTKGDIGSKEIVVINLTDYDEYLTPGFCNDDDVKACSNVTYDPDESILSIPCVEAFGKVFTLDMKQRGNSENWQIEFIEEIVE